MDLGRSSPLQKQLLCLLASQELSHLDEEMVAVMETFSKISGIIHTDFLWAPHSILIYKSLVGPVGSITG